MKPAALRPICGTDHPIGLDSGGRGVCYSTHRGVIVQARLFADQPFLLVPMLLYQVPLANGWLPYATPFRLRWMENEKLWFPDRVGWASWEQRIYKGPIPDGNLGTIVGNADEWMNGLNYQRWLANGYNNPNGCFVTQEQLICSWGRPPAWTVWLGSTMLGVQGIGEASVGTAYHPLYQLGTQGIGQANDGEAYNPLYQLGTQGIGQGEGNTWFVF